MATFKYLLETSTCIELLRGNEIVRQKCIEQNQYQKQLSLSVSLFFLTFYLASLLISNEK